MGLLVDLFQGFCRGLGAGVGGGGGEVGGLGLSLGGLYAAIGGVIVVIVIAISIGVIVIVVAEILRPVVVIVEPCTARHLLVIQISLSTIVIPLIRRHRLLSPLWFILLPSLLHRSLIEPLRQILPLALELPLEQLLPHLDIRIKRRLNNLRLFHILMPITDHPRFLLLLELVQHPLEAGVESLLVLF